jgi:hypothetical protein
VDILLIFSLDTEYNVGLLEMAIPPVPKLQLIDAILEQQCDIPAWPVCFCTIVDTMGFRMVILSLLLA